MPEKPHEAFKRCHRESGFSIRDIAALLDASTSMVTCVQRGARRVPRSWVDRLPPEFAPVIEAMIAEQLDEVDRLEAAWDKLQANREGEAP